MTLSSGANSIGRTPSTQRSLFAWGADKDDDYYTKRLRYFISNVELGSLPTYICTWILICAETSAVDNADKCVLAKILWVESASEIEHCALPNQRLRIQTSGIHSCKGLHLKHASLAQYALKTANHCSRKCDNGIMTLKPTA
ncbi:hypothetical protein EVAR_32681_1 [Eumeta japonica]|uniref:Uncharacterized protein n=1 Tax=Eumeta variegata TaxID=151549 RepID=A0A4C1VNG3_EUMVA|nr:hypothetical protein EVAR_32681_1 [Eumeta japonica]